jgi:DUF2975 family protein
MNVLATVALRAFILFTLLASLFAQLAIIPATATNQAENYPAFAPLATPYAAIAITTAACLQAALIATWKLLSMIEKNAIFTNRAYRWLDVITWSAATATALTAGVATHLWTLDLDEPAISMIFTATAATFIGTAFILLMTIFRGLLRKATANELELAAVV